MSLLAFHLSGVILHSWLAYDTHYTIPCTFSSGFRLQSNDPIRTHGDEQRFRPSYTNANMIRLLWRLPICEAELPISYHNFFFLNKKRAQMACILLRYNSMCRPRTDAQTVP